MARTGFFIDANLLVRLGLTDAAILEAVTAETPLVTVDLDLYLAAWKKGPGLAVNFTHYSGP